MLFEARSELDPDAIYIQIVRPGLVNLPERALSLAEIRAAVDRLPDSSQRETAGENMVLVELVTASERTRK